MMLMGKRNIIFVMTGLSLGGLLLLGSPAGAQTYYHPSYDQREDYQQHRIQQGVDSGSLTPGEARYLEREQNRIQATEDRMRADGRLSPWERERLRQMQGQANRDIYRLDHNGRTAENWNGNHYGWDQGNHNGWGNHWNSGWDNHANRGWDGHQYADWDGRRPYDPRYEHREDRQQHRIQHGIHTGELGPGEARYLERQQGHIQNVEDRMRADGRLSPWERQRLNHMQNRASRDIYRMDHNGRPAAGYSGSQTGWQGNNNGWQGRGYGSQGNNSGSYGTTPSGTPVTGATSTGISPAGATQGWQGHHGNWNGTAPTGTTTNSTTPTGTTTTNTQASQGYRYSGDTASTSGTTTSGTPTASNTQGWRGNHSGGNGYTPNNTATSNGAATAGNAQGWHGNYAHQGQPGAFRQPGPQARNFGGPAPWQGQPRFQQARPQFTPNMGRPNGNFMARQPGGFVGRVNRANYSPRRR
jgi:hypothetical protein